MKQAQCYGTGVGDGLGVVTGHKFTGYQLENIKGWTNPISIEFEFCGHVFFEGVRATCSIWVWGQSNAISHNQCYLCVVLPVQTN